MAERAPRISVDEALAIIAANMTPLDSESVPIAAAFGRVTTAAVAAGADAPRFRASAMDGFAVASRTIATACAEAVIALPIGALVPAGTWPPPLPPGETVPIATGAPVPDGADAVLTRETATIVDGRLVIHRPIEAGRNVRAIGEDIARGATILPAGVRLAADMIGVLAAFGVAKVDVRRVPHIGLIATGSELAEAGSGALDPAALVDSNSPMIAACAAAAGLGFGMIGRAPDRGEAIDLLLDAATRPAAGDVILSTGGVSVGDFDLVRARLEDRGCRILFHGIAMRPGKPLLFALLPDGRPFFGLPGTPLAALTGFRFFVGAAIRRMLGLPAETGEAVASAEPGRPGTTLFLRGRRTLDDQGRLAIDTAMDQRSHILHSLLQADCWLRVDRPGDGPPTARMHAKDLPLV
jgi:molybdopterin molybdotransferase